MKSTAIQKKKIDWLCGVFWLFAIPILAFIAGSILLGIGISFKNSTAILDADTDFTQLKDQCPITEVTWIRTKQHTGDKGSHTGCSDYWIYSFTAYNLSNEDSFYHEVTDEFKSYEHEIRRECNTCSKCDKEEPRFEVGMESSCWRPSIAHISSSSSSSSSGLSRWYRCGNEYCIKILPPQEDEDRARNLATAIFLSGVIILPASIPLLTVAYFIFKKYCSSKKPWEEEGVWTQTTSAAEPSTYATTNEPSSFTVTNQIYNKHESNNTGGQKSLFDELNSANGQTMEA